MKTPSSKPMFWWLPAVIQVFAIIGLVAAIVTISGFPSTILVTVGGLVTFVAFMALSMITKAAIIYIDKNE